MRSTRLLAVQGATIFLLAIGCTMPTGEQTPGSTRLDPSLAVSPAARTPIARVTLTPATASIIVGGTVKLTATAYDSSGNVVTGRKTSWGTYNGKIATVVGGMVTGVRAGTTTIVATIGTKIGSAVITVGGARVTSVTVSPSTATMTVGGTQTLFAVAKDSAGNTVTGRPITWTSSATSIATVSSSGLVSAVAAGAATVRATIDGVIGSSAITVTSTTPPPPSSGRWLSGYYVGYQRSLYPESAIDFSVLTHIFVGAIEPTSNGGVTTDFWIDNTNGPIMARNISTRAHQYGRKAVLMLGGAGYRNALLSATSPTNIATFVNNLVNTMTSLGYDGIDVDWEPVLDSDKPVLLDLFRRLRAARPSMILTMPVMWINSNWETVDPWYAQVAGVVDQINIMSYGMADNWNGWQSWHQGALFGEGATHPSSVSSSASAYVVAGVPSQKVGIGLGFYGSCWRGTSTMLQTLSLTAGVVASDNVMSYTNIMNQYYSSAAYRWDATAKAGYLAYSVPTGPQQCTMISYENAQSLAEKGSYVKSANLGGAIVWTINQGHMPTAPVGQKDPLLTAAYNAIVP
jgi:chitinase